MDHLKHILLPVGNIPTKKYSPKNSFYSNFSVPERDFRQHCAIIRGQYDRAWEEQTELLRNRAASGKPTRKGIYVLMEPAKGYELPFDNLDPARNVRLVNIQAIRENEKVIRKDALVYLEENAKKWLDKNLNKYETLDQKVKHNPSVSEKIVSTVESIVTPKLEDFWIEETPMPSAIKEWIEVWLYVKSDLFASEQVQSFQTILQNLNINFKANFLSFPERVILLIEANQADMNELILSSNLINEFRKGQVAAGFLADAQISVQREWLDMIHNKLIVNDESHVSVCVIDTGVNWEHPLLSPVIREDECLSVNQGWNTRDRRGHGTLMAGVAAYGDLTHCIESSSPISVLHRLCSVKLLPNSGENLKELWGDFTMQAVSRMEISLPDNHIVYCMAITEPDGCPKGRPSSWSSALDNICYEEGNKRLVIVSGGNIDDNKTWSAYPDGNATVTVHNPAQSWNVITVGAYTNKHTIDDDTISSPQLVAPAWGISPFSSTSSLWDNEWPIKPEVVFEGGNLLQSEDHSSPFVRHPDLEILTTSMNIDFQIFDTINATSAATAEASRVAAMTMAVNPELWPESVRGLFVHTADWTEVMREQFLKCQGGRMINLLRNCGYGIPDINRMLYSVNNGLTLIAQNVIQPYKLGASSITMNEMQIYELPWPKDLLLSMGEVEVKLRITLSYYIEPGPGEVGWAYKYRYASAGLRFDLNTSSEDIDQLRQRLSKIDEDESPVDTMGNDTSRWEIGIKNRNRGSVHTDRITTTAADLATCNLIAIYPVSGWWKTRKNMKRWDRKLRYSLLISLEAPSVDVDLYNVVKSMITIPVPIEVGMR